MVSPDKFRQRQPVHEGFYATAAADQKTLQKLAMDLTHNYRIRSHRSSNDSTARFA